MLTLCFRFRSFPVQSASFRPPLFRFWLLSLCFFLSFSSPLRLTAAFRVPPFRLSASRLFHFRSARFPVLPFRFSVLGFLFVSFRPSLIRSHSCSSGASLLLSLSGFPLTSAFFRPLPSGSDYSAFRSFLSLLPVLPCRRFLRCFFPLPIGLLPCLSSDSGTQLSAFPFSVRCLASQWLPQRLNLLPFGFRPLPLGFRFRFWLLGPRSSSYQEHLIRFVFHFFRSELLYITIAFSVCQQLFSKIFIFLFLYYFAYTIGWKISNKFKFRLLPIYLLEPFCKAFNGKPVIQIFYWSRRRLYDFFIRFSFLQTFIIRSQWIPIFLLRSI